MNKKRQKSREHQRSHSSPGIIALTRVEYQPVNSRRRQIAKQIVAEIGNCVGSGLVFLFHSAEHDTGLAGEDGAAKEEQDPEKGNEERKVADEGNWSRGNGCQESYADGEVQSFTGAVTAKSCGYIAADDDSEHWPSNAYDCKSHEDGFGFDLQGIDQIITDPELNTSDDEVEGGERQANEDKGCVRVQALYSSFKALINVSFNYRRVRVLSQIK